jgi:triosephosphate isomerase
MKKLLVANWKLNPSGLGEAIELAKATDKNGVVICPPFVFLPRIKKVLKHAALGAQDVFWEKRGAYTGEVSGRMLRELGVSYVIIGHSERRHWLHETDEMVNKKVKAALGAGLKVILCVGEPAKRGLTRTSRGLTRNERSAKNYIRKQLEKDLRGVRFLRNKKSLRRSTYGLRKSALLVAYEPIWAIGTGKADRPSDTAEMAKFIKKFLSTTYHLSPTTKVLYGGSATSRNIKNFLQYKEIDGALVGGASLNVKEFNKIINIVSRK